jgi:hypothetical protein
MVKDSESQDLQRLSGRTKHGSDANEMVEGRGTQQESSEEIRGNVLLQLLGKKTKKRCLNGHFGGICR